MYLTPQDIWYIVASICLVAITIFLCLVLYRLLRVIRQADEIVTTTREKVAFVEETVENLVERFTTLSGYASLVSEGGKKLLSLVGDRGSASKKSKKKLAEEEAEDED